MSLKPNETKLKTDEVFAKFGRSDDEEWQRAVFENAALVQTQIEMRSGPGSRLKGTAWAKHYFPNHYSRPFTAYQTEFWNWGESIAPGTHTRPRIECEPRAVGKSSNGEGLAVRWLAKKAKRFIVFIGRTDDKVLQHFSSVKSMLENKDLTKDYPHLRPKIHHITNRISGWKADQIITADGRVVMALTLESARGLKSGELNLRPDAIIFDDLDLETDSPHVIQKNLTRLRSDIIPAGDIEGETVYLYLQNLIHRDSIVAQILDHRADILSDRIFCGPFPMLNWYDAVKEDIVGDETGAKRWRITAGEPYDPAITLDYAETLLNRFGKKGFDREMQQLVTVIGEDKDFREWDEIYHISTWSEVVAGFHAAGAKDIEIHRIPARWEVGKGLDAGTTVGHPTVCTYFTIPDKRYPFSDIHLGLKEVCLPKFPRDITEIAEVVSPGRIAQALANVERDLRLEESQIKQEKMSHEASAMLNTFLIDLAPEIQQTFSKWKAARGSGVPQMQNLMEIDYTKPHPFRKYPKGHEKAGQPIMGRTRFILIVEDGQGELYADSEGKLRVRGADDAGGWSRTRFEIPLYSHLNTGQNKIDDDACFVAGTQIQTESGARPIETIQVGDSVWTRTGLEPVLASGPTGIRPVINRGGLIGTPNHPVFTHNRGFIRLDALRGNDTIHTWENERTIRAKAKWRNLTASAITAIQKLNNTVTEFISKRTTTLDFGGFLPTTSIYGNPSTVPFRWDAISTIKTKIHSIMTFQTWNVSPAPTINGCTIRAAQLRHSKSTWLRFARLRSRGIVAKKDELGIANTVRRWQRRENHIALFAGIVRSLTSLFKNGASGAHLNAKTQPAHPDDGRLVYNLTVANSPEYFANGVLVHNCDSIRGLHATFGLKSADLTRSEKIEEAIPEGYRLKDRLERSPYENGLLPQDELGYYISKAIAEKSIKSRVKVHNPTADWGFE